MNAGHLPPKLVRKQGSIEVPLAGGPPLGCIREGIRYESGRFQIYPGDNLLFYTDGIPEAVDSAGEFYQKTGRFDEILLRMNKREKACDLEEIVADVQDFSRSDSFEDDITLLCLHREV